MTTEFKEKIKETPTLIGIMGAIGVGKSTLSDKLSGELEINLIRENFPMNPFLAKFYDDPKRYSFRSQAWFLRSTVDQMVSMKQTFRKESVILDPANEMNFLFAKTHKDMGWMSDREFSLYKWLYKSLNIASGVKSPDLYVWLYSPDVRLLEKRISERGRSFELSFFGKYPGYLPALNQNLLNFVSEKGKSNFLHVDPEIDFNDPVQLKGVIEKLRGSLPS
jgi:deoxyguanosine kinase